MPRFTVDDVVKKLVDVHGDTVFIDASTYVNTSTKVRFVDVVHGEWWATPNNIMKNRRHPLRGRSISANKRRRWTIKRVVERLKEIHGDTVTLDLTTYVDISTKARFVDKDYGEWWGIPRRIASGRHHPTRGAKLGHDRTRTSLQDVLDAIKCVHGQTVTMDVSTYVKASQVTRFIDADYGEFWTTPTDVITSPRAHPERGRKKQHDNQRLTIAELQERLQIVHQGIVVLDATTYVDTKTKARFIDNKHGEWWATANNILRGRSHPNRQPEKIAHTMNSFPTVQHWLTGELCHSRSGYEYVVLLWLNANQYDFDWQVPIFTPLSTKKSKRLARYVVDLRIKSGPFTSTYVEIKGWWGKRTIASKRKWEWFHETYSNSQLWMKDELIALGIITDWHTYSMLVKSLTVHTG